MDRLEIGVMPYYIEDGELQLVLVTTRGGKRWIFPKGNPEPGMSHVDVASMEAFEEAGVIGRIDKKGRKTVRMKRDGQSVVLLIYPMEVHQVLDEWPEMHQRTRSVVTPAVAEDLINNKKLVHRMKRLLKTVAWHYRSSGSPTVVTK